MNLLYGGNGQGKTSLLEALWMFTGLASFRTNRAAEIIRFGAPVCQATLDFLRDNREQQAQLEIRRQPARRRFWVNGVPRQPGSPELGFSMVLFTPDDLGLLKNGPVQRRELLDTVLCQLYPRYRKNLSEYQRCLAQRNTLLKAVAKSGKEQGVQNQNLLEVLDAALSKLGVYLVRERAALTGRLAFYAGRLYQCISGGSERLAVCYQSGAFPASVRREQGDFSVYREEASGARLEASVQDVDALNAQAQAILASGREGLELSFYDLLQSRRKADLGAGFTTAGAHRDDLVLLLNGRSARLFGSQGQQRTAALCCRLAAAELLYELSGERPVVLLDDVLSELDDDRKRVVWDTVTENQIFLTGCDEAYFSQLPTAGRQVRLFRVQEGQVSRTG